ncbi:hypothetical protein VM95_08570 [Streptomyces rubellomurinus]|uniref:Uncharacterized protein n=1 Tax=Streptomyces rubellomurinus (strain ATCC 31215) TaxID=359131 RepID=A0A0F2TGU6_STRR3|nr:hypothetical protein VM95_08570 [Streptomyces rubellomurinus]
MPGTDLPCRARGVPAGTPAVDERFEAAAARPVRNGEAGANCVTVDGELFGRYLAGFEEPVGEGEQVLAP